MRHSMLLYGDGVQKKVLLGASPVKKAVCLAAIKWNCGKNCYKITLKIFGLKSNFFTDKIIGLKDYER